MSINQTIYKPEAKLLLVLALLSLLSFAACVKKSDQANQTGSVAAELQNKSNILPLLEPQPMKLCVRPAHRLGLKKCVRNGKWVRLSLAAKDVDNDRTDVFSNPRLSLKKENFYPDTFRFLDGINHIGNYPDYYHASAAYGGFAHMIFAMSNQAPIITYGYAGRDEVKENLTRSLTAMNPAQKEWVKIQHWNDGGTFKKFAQVYFEIIGEYSETNHRYECGWMEQDQGYDFTQVKTKDNVEVPKIPETFIWRKMAESCNQLPIRSVDSRLNYLPFREINQNALSTDHKFTLNNRNKIKIYNIKAPFADEQEARFDTVNPMSLAGMKTDGSTTLFLNTRKEEVSRWESLYEEDLKDISFQPERTK